MGVWRIHIKNDVCEGYSRDDLLAFCKEKQLIGVGWNDITTREDSEEAVRTEAEKLSDPGAAFKAINTMRKIRLDDLIWSRLNGVYYLCRVTGLWKDRNPEQIHRDLDISNYVGAQWLEIGPEDLIPGKVVSSFRPPASAQSINDVENISRYLWNKYSNTSYYPVKNEKMDIWSMLSAESIEELVLLYLQVCKGYFIYSTTMKYATREYECVMVDHIGRYAYPQVKSGSVSLRADDYMDAVLRDPAAQVYLFAASERYIVNGCPNIHFISKREMEEFMQKYRFLLPKLALSWLELCKFGENETGGN